MLAMGHVEAPLLATLPLPARPHIVVAGAYKGDTVRFLLHHYADAYIRAYEPQQWALEQVPVDDRVDRRAYGLCTCNGQAAMHSVGTDAASMQAAHEDTDNTRRHEMLPVRDAVQELAEYKDKPLSLMVLNVEGYEYVLLPYLLDSGIVPVRLLVQFHHYKTHEAAAYVGLQEWLRTKYIDVREVGKGWWYYA